MKRIKRFAVCVLIAALMVSMLTPISASAETYALGDKVNLLEAGYGSSDGTSGRRMIYSSGVYVIKRIVSGYGVKYPYGIGPENASSIDGWVSASMISPYSPYLQNQCIENSYELYANLDAAIKILGCFATGNYEGISPYILPNKGVKFSPYAYVDDTAQTYWPTYFANYARLKDLVTWGYYDGSGNPMIMTFQEYIDTWILNSEYFNRPIIGINRIVQSGNTIINITEAFGANAQFIEFHFPGTPQNDYMDWSSLRLVFVDGYLAGVVSDCWTI